MITPIISFILCVRNGERYIKDCVDSILNQSFQDFELIIIFNGTTDSSKEILSLYLDERIFVHETQIEQLSFNLNLGINNARGMFISRIDVDDICYPNRLERQLFFLHKFNCDIVGSNISVIDSDGNFLHNFKYPETNKEIRNSIFFKSVLCHPSVIIRKEILLKNNGYLGGRYAQDFDLWIRLMRDKNHVFYNVQENLVKYRIHLNQSKGDCLSYSEVSGYFWREFVYSMNPKFLFSSLLYLAKRIFLSK